MNASRESLRVDWATLLLVSAASMPVACERPGGSGDAVVERVSGDTRATEPGGPVFVDETARSGVDFTHDPSADGGFTYPEPIGAGAGAIDYDGDGDLDLYLVQGGRIPGTTRGRVLPNRMFRNDGNGVFEDVTEATGTGDTSFGMGVACADLDNDGDPDMLVTNVGPNTVYANNGDGTFADVTAASGLGDDASYSLCTALVDIDLDGLLDVYVTNYVVWRPGADPTCHMPSGILDYCGPSKYRGASDRLYRNLGNLVFEDITERAGIDARTRRSMGVVAADFDGDTLVDLYVANDGEPNTLWMNQGNGTFRDEAIERGCAVNRSGQAEASMGLACADIDGDGDLDLYLTHLRLETHTFYRNDERTGLFEDATVAMQLGGFSRMDTGFGLVFADLDNDGRRDFFVANGGVQIEAQPIREDLPYAQLNRLVRQTAPGTFVDVSSGEPALASAEMSRGALVADFDGDGRLDLCVTNNRGPVQMLRNQAPAGHWVGIALRGVQDNRDGIGSIVTVTQEASGGATREGARHHRLSAPYRGYLCSNDPAVHVGLGSNASACRVTVRWPSGRQEVFEPLAVDTQHELEQGTGRARQLQDE